MGQNGASVDVNFVTDGDVVAQNSNVFQPRPLADGAVPPNDGRLDPCVVLNLASSKENAALQPDAVTDNNVRSNGHVGAYAAVLANLGRGIDENVATVNERLAVGSELLGALLREGGKVEAGSGQEVLGLANIHPESIQVERVQQAVLANSGEGLLLNRGGAQVDTVQHRGVQDVDTGVDAVANELDGLLDEAVDARCVAWLVHHHAVLGRLLDLCDDDGALITVCLVEVGELLEGVVADDIGVQDEEGRVVLAKDLLGQLQRAGGAQRLVLDGELYADVVLLLVL